MTIYIEDKDTVKIYPVKVKVAKAVMTLLESDCELVWSETHKGYGVEIIDKEDKAKWIPVPGGFVCSECNNKESKCRVKLATTRFCPDCGRRMES